MCSGARNGSRLRLIRAQPQGGFHVGGVPELSEEVTKQPAQLEPAPCTQQILAGWC